MLKKRVMLRFVTKLFLLLLFTCGLFVSATAQVRKDYKTILQKRLAASSLNLIPDSAGITPNYWCTWSAQNFAVDSVSVVHSIGLGDHRLFADNLTEEAVFNKPDWESYLPAQIRKDLFIVFDVGWDIPGGQQADSTKWIIGSMEVATDKFPSLTGTPQERLTKLNELVRSRGWKGAGLWIAAQTAMDSRKENNITDSAIEAYYRERARWSKAAGIKYWKVDYGNRGGNNTYRQMLTRVAAEEAPGLWVEHGRGGGPLNDEECPWDTKNYFRKGSYRTWDNGAILAKAVSLLQFSDVLRTYDVTAQLSIPTTIDRVAQILAEIKTPTASKGLINCEDEVYVAAALGCAMGVMRHPLFIDVKNNPYNPLHVEKAMDEVTRAVRWQRMAPAFGAGRSTVQLSNTVLKDTWAFEKGDSWAAWMAGKTGMQSAPAVVARGIALPQVQGKTVPFVLVSRNPTGAIAIATMKRTQGRSFYFPLAHVRLQVEDATRIGVFGRYAALTLVTNKGNSPLKVMAQDLVGDKAIDITDLISCRGNEITLDGTLLQALGTMQASKGDRSEPGLLLVLSNK